MRFIQRNHRLTPQGLQNPVLKKAIKNIQSAIIRQEQVRGTLFELRNAIYRIVVPALQEQFHHRCAYCETPTRSPESLDWFRPDVGADRGNGKVDQYHYAWLVGEWGNMYLACHVCNKNKSNRFPTDTTAKYGASIRQLRRDKEAILLDPCYDHPADHFLIDADGHLLAKTDRAAKTSNVLQLNRPELTASRRVALRDLSEAWNKSIATDRHNQDIMRDSLLRMLQTQAPHVGAFQICLWQLSRPRTRKLLRQMISQGANSEFLERLLVDIGPISTQAIDDAIKREVAKRNSTPSLVDDPRFHLLRKISIRNFKGILELELNFPREHAAHIAIVGENATGKTSILQAIALGLAGHQHANTHVNNPASLLAEGADEGEIIAHFWGTDDYNHVRFHRAGAKLSGETQQASKVFGYGPYRLLSNKQIGKTKRNPTVRLSSLFIDGCPLNGHHGWLSNLTAQQRIDLAEVLQLLLVSSDSKVTVDTTTLHITTNGRAHPIESLSSGMQSITSMCTDLMEALYASGDSVLANGYAIIIDELDAHLHPRWRIGIVERLKQAFPYAQIIFSTHDPLTLRGLDAEQIRIIHRSADGALNARTSTYADSQSIDQILTSPAFGMLSTHPPKWEEHFARYIELLRKDDEFSLTTDEAQELATLTRQLSKHRMLGDSRREQIMLAVIDEMLMQESHRNYAWDATILKQLAEQVQARLDHDGRSKS